MEVERTLAIIKPDGVAAGAIGEIISRIEDAGLKVVAMRMERLSRSRAEGFYFIHRDKPFFGSLMDFMTSGPVVLMVLQGRNAVERWRQIMGPTDPRKADKGTIRADIGTSIEKNAVHGSDSRENAITEISYFFGGQDIHEINIDKVMNSGSR